VEYDFCDPRELSATSRPASSRSITRSDQRHLGYEEAAIQVCSRRQRALASSARAADLERDQAYAACWSTI